MALPKRNRRTIVCAGRAYHWQFPRGRDWEHRPRPVLTVRVADAAAGAPLLVEQAEWPDVTPTFVAGAIAEALAAGWRPDAAGVPFHLRRER